MISNSRSRSKKGAYNDIYSIKDLEVSQDEELQVYPRAYAIPQFFTENLVDENRIIKIFNSQNAVIQAFAFQYMKLALEIEVQGNNDYLQVAKDIFIKGKDGLIGQDGELSDQILTDFQYRKFFKDFVQIVQAQIFPDFQQTAKKYPIIKKVLKKLFNKLVPFTLFLKDSESEICTDFDIVGQIFQYLSNIFEIKLNLAGDLQCYKFQESDMFVYVQNLNQIYIAYIDQKSLGEEDQFFKSTNSSFVCGEGNSFTSKFKRTKSNKSATQNSFKRRKNQIIIQQKDSQRGEQQNLPIQQVKQYQNMVESKVSQNLPQKLQSYNDYMNFSIKRRSQNNSNSISNSSSFSKSSNNNNRNHDQQIKQLEQQINCNKDHFNLNNQSKFQSLSHQNKSNTIIDILQSRALENKLSSVQSIENVLNSGSQMYQPLTHSSKVNSNKWQTKYQVQEIVQMKQEQQLTENTINSFNRLNQNPSYLKGFSKSNDKNAVFQIKPSQRTSLNQKIIQKQILKETPQQWVKIHQKENLSQFIRPSFKIKLQGQTNSNFSTIIPPNKFLNNYSTQINKNSQINQYRQKQKLNQNKQIHKINRYQFENDPKLLQEINMKNDNLQSKLVKFTKIDSQTSLTEMYMQEVNKETEKFMNSQNVNYLGTKNSIDQGYNQFTQSRILELLEPQYRVKIKQIKQKFKQESKKQKKINFVSVSGSRQKKINN